MIASLALVAVVVPSETLTLDRALEIGRANAFSVRTARTRVAKAEELIAASRGALGPTVSLTAAYSRFEGSVGGGPFGFGGSPGSGGTVRRVDPPPAIPAVPNESKSASVTVSQVIDLGPALRSQVEAARLSRDAEQAGLEAALRDLDLRVREAYYDVLLTSALVMVQREALRAESERLETARRRQEAGAVPPFDVLRLQNAVRRTEQLLLQAEGDALTAKQALNDAIGRPIETEFEPSPVLESPPLPDDPDALVPLAIAARPEVRRAVLGVGSIGKVADSNRRGLDPSLVLSATHSRIVDPSPGQRDSGTVGTIAVQWPVFDSGVTRARVQAARRDEEEARIGLERLALGIALEVRAAFTRLRTARETLAVALDSVQVSREALRLAQLRYDEGAGLLIDVTQAQAELTAALGSVEVARSQALKAYAALQRAVGRDDLGVDESEAGEGGR